MDLVFVSNFNNTSSDTIFPSISCITAITDTNFICIVLDKQIVIFDVIKHVIIHESSLYYQFAKEQHSKRGGSFFLLKEELTRSLSAPDDDDLPLSSEESHESSKSHQDTIIGLVFTGYAIACVSSCGICIEIPLFTMLPSIFPINPAEKLQSHVFCRVSRLSPFITTSLVHSMKETPAAELLITCVALCCNVMICATLRHGLICVCVCSDGFMGKQYTIPLIPTQPHLSARSQTRSFSSESEFLSVESEFEVISDRNQGSGSEVMCMCQSKHSMHFMFVGLKCGTVLMLFLDQKVDCEMIRPSDGRNLSSPSMVSRDPTSPSLLFDVCEVVQLPSAPLRITAQRTVDGGETLVCLCQDGISTSARMSGRGKIYSHDSSILTHTHGFPYNAIYAIPAIWSLLKSRKGKCLTSPLSCSSAMFISDCFWDSSLSHRVKSICIEQDPSILTSVRHSLRRDSECLCIADSGDDSHIVCICNNGGICKAMVVPSTIVTWEGSFPVASSEHSHAFHPPKLPLSLLPLTRLCFPHVPAHVPGSSRCINNIVDNNWVVLVHSNNVCVCMKLCEGVIVKNDTLRIQSTNPSLVTVCNDHLYCITTCERTDICYVFKYSLLSGVLANVIRLPIIPTNLSLSVIPCDSSLQDSMSLISKGFADSSSLTESVESGGGIESSSQISKNRSTNGTPFRYISFWNAQQVCVMKCCESDEIVWCDQSDEEIEEEEEEEEEGEMKQSGRKVDIVIKDENEKDDEFHSAHTTKDVSSPFHLTVPSNNIVHVCVYQCSNEESVICICRNSGEVLLSLLSSDTDSKNRLSSDGNSES
ncbi:hypothetical protein ADUPG1_008537, partial [Aduncisulcus paluster]